MSLANARSSDGNRHSAQDALKALACLALVGSLLGLSFVIAKLAVGRGAPPLGFLFYTLIGAGALLLVIERCKGHALRIDRRLVEYGLVAGTLFLIPNAFGFLAVAHVGAGFVSLTFAFPILITYILAVLLRMDRLRLDKTMAVVLGLSGGCIIASSKAFSGDSAPIWVILSVISPLIVAVGNIYRTLRWPPGASPNFLAALMLLSAGIALMPVAIAAGQTNFVDLIAEPSVLALLALQTGLFCVLYLFYFVLQRLAGPVYLSQIGIVAAFVGTIVAVAFLGESTPAYLLPAALLILAATALFQRASRSL